jgi:undecaprenyl-diphosphatase
MTLVEAVVLGVVVYFAGDMWAMGRAAAKGLRSGRLWESQEARLAWFIVIGTFPIGICGLALKKHIEGEWRSLYVIAVSLILLGLLLWMAERLASFQKGLAQIGWFESQLVGLAQAVALIPGSSRSGTTMTAAIAIGIIVIPPR